MTSSLDLKLTPLAWKDFRGILRSTRKTWGEEQRLAYGSRLMDAMDQLTRHPLQGKTRDDIPAGMRARPVGQHVIFYRADEQAITVIRILHARMDAAVHLGS